MNLPDYVAIHPDQAIQSKTNPNRSLLYYPRGQQQTLLAWLCDQNPPRLDIANISEDNGFTQWFQDGSGNWINDAAPRLNAPACKIVGFR